MARVDLDMKILLLSTYDSCGGAARASLRLHRGLQSINVNSQMLVQTKYLSDPSITGFSSLSGREKIIAASRLSFGQLPLKLYPGRDKQSYFSPQYLPDKLDKEINKIAPDIVNLHWICDSYLQIETLTRLSKPLVWTLHDMWPFTGGCHYSGDCSLYTKSCGSCPQIGSHRNCDLSRWIWSRKQKAWSSVDLTIVSPSAWLADCARSSSLFQDRRIEIIPNALDLDVYQPIEKRFARKLLGLPQDKLIVLFGSLLSTSQIKKRKGFHLLQPALQQLASSNLQDRLELVILGASQPPEPPDFGFKCNYINTLNDDISLAMLYSAADIFVLPSIEDNLPNTILEALSCGTPCVAFGIGGIPDMIDHKRNGYLAEPYSVHDFSQGIYWLLENQDRQKKTSFFSRQKAEREFGLEIQALRYESLFKEIMVKNNFA